MTTLFLIRHAETDATGKSTTGWLPGWHLNQTGKQQAQRLARRMSRVRLQAIYTSPLERARETAEAIAETQSMEPRQCNELGEWRLGEWEGLSIQDLDQRESWQKFNLFRSGFQPPGGESMMELQTRAVRQLQYFAALHEGGSVAAVSHAEPIRAALAHFLGTPLDLALRIEIHPASVSIVELDGGMPRILSVNGTGEAP